MLSRLRQIFSKPQPELSAESRDFITKLAPSHVWLLVIGLRGTPSVPLGREDAYLMLDSHRIDVAEMTDDDSVFPFNYWLDGIQILPFFTSKDGALAFRTDSGLRADLSFYQPYGLLSGFVATPENEVFELVLNPHTPSERRFTRDERLLLRALSTPAAS
ncbi:MAG: hypothetical protein EBS05_20535 [Proteobacteria bacterium]|nr:hypothetical protein [Pseudomonadota bacterium]